MKKVFLIASVFVTGIISCSAQKTEQRIISPFTKIKLAGSVNVIYTNSDTLDLKVSAAAGEMERVYTKVEDQVLVIENKGNFRSPVNIYVKNKQLNFIEASGATNFSSADVFINDSLVIFTSGASHVTCITDINKVNCDLGGASSVKLSGKSNQLNLTLSGASSFKGYGHTAQNAEVVTTGASSARVFVANKIKASASGASSVKIKGDPKEVSAEATPAASVSKVNGQVSASNKTENDTVTYVWKSKKFIIVTDEDKIEAKKEKTSPDLDDFKHWSGFAMGVNGYFNNTGGLNMLKGNKYMDLNYSRSFDFQFNLFERQFNLAQNYVKLITGLGIDYHIYALANKTILNADSSFTFGRIDTSNTYTYVKNRLRSTYVQVPLLIEFNTSNNPDKTFHLAFGVIGQYLIASRTKQELEENKNDYVKVRKDSYNLSPFAAKAHVNLGYKGWTFFAEYSLTPLFQQGRGPELYPFTAGVRLVPFT